MIIGVLIVLVFFVLLMLFIGTLMRRAELSLRPLAFFAIFMGIVAGPQAVYHLSNALSAVSAPSTSAPSTTSTPSTSTLPIDESVFAIADGRFANPQAVFGANVDTTLIVPVKESLNMIFARAEVAEMAASVDGTVFAARFPDDEAALDAQERFAQTMAVANAIGDDAQGYIGDKLSSGERVQFIAAGPIFMAWTAQNDEALAARREMLATALQVLPVTPIASAKTAVVTSENLAVDDRVPFGSLPLALTFLAINVLAAVLWFFKGTAWATKVSPKPGVHPIRLNELRERLLAVNQTDTPVQVELSDDSNTIYITWRYADARWIDHASAHGMRRIHRLALTLTESDHTVRAREYIAAVDWSAGFNAASINWRAATGIVFFQYDHARVFGLQLAPNGSLTPNLSYSYTFNLQELKGPFIQAVTHAGWTWRPVFFNAPKPLKWLTE